MTYEYIIYGGVAVVVTALHSTPHIYLHRNSQQVFCAHKNRFQSVGILPVGVVLDAGLLNKVEVGLTDMVNTAMSPLISYDDAGNGQGMDMIRELYSFVQKDFRFSDSYDP